MTPSQTIFIQTAARIAAGLAQNPAMIDPSNEYRRHEPITGYACMMAGAILRASEQHANSTPSQPSGKGEFEGEEIVVVEAAKR